MRGGPYTIRWSATSGAALTGASVSLSTDDGGHWQPISECASLPGSATSCVWNSVEPVTNYGRVAVTVTDAAARSATGSSGRFTVRARPGTSLNYGWSHADVGDVGAAGSATHDGFIYDGEGLTVTGSGADIWGTADEFHYVWKAFSGEFDMTTRVETVQNVNAWTKAGIMVRANAVNAGSRHASIFATPGKGIAFQRRVNDGGASVSTAGPALRAPVWLRMVRVGTVLRAYYRKVPTENWTLLGQQEMTGLPSTVDVGVAVSSHADGTRATARFQGVYLASLPAFAGTAVGGATGSWTSDGTNYTVKGSGRDIWGLSDSFFFSPYRSARITRSRLAFA